MILLILSLILSATPVYAHPIDTAFFDFELTASGTTLTVAMQPPEAFEVVRRPSDRDWNTERFRERGDMLAAFVGSHVELSRGEQSCTWDPVMGPVATSTFDALADGIWVSGLIVCSVESGPFTLTSDLFMDRFPSQQNTVRVVGDDPYAELMTMTSSSPTIIVDVGSERPATSSISETDQPTNQVIFLLIIALASGLVVFHVVRRYSTRIESTGKIPDTP